MNNGRVTINGNTVDFDCAVELMDDDIREDVHRHVGRFADCTLQGFVDEYCKRHQDKYSTPFEVA